MLKACKKTDNLRYIAKLYALLDIPIIQLKLKLYICLHGTFLELKNS